MSYYIGIDLGTSAMKLLLMTENGEIKNTVSKKYPLEFPAPGFSQQNPSDWKKALFEGIPELIKNTEKSLIKGIGVGGQMHGLVVLDEADEVIRPAILWNDSRTAKQTHYLNTVIGKEKLSEYTANIAFAGFTAPKLLWMKEEETENFNRIAKIMLPKDYINYILTGVHACDFSDASGMLLLDVKNKCWSKEMLEICSVKESQLPRLFESYEKIGTLKKDVANRLSLPESVIVCAGAGDNAAAAIGTGTVGQGSCNISLGTSGTVFISSEKFGVDPHNSLHSFAHADGSYHLMGCILSAASCNKWFMEEICKTSDYKEEQKNITDEKLGRNNIYFLPYLMGERSPINDTDARGTFIGLSMNTSRADMLLAVLEGVAFALRDCVEVAKSLGIEITTSKICGGGAASDLWKKIIANVLNTELQTLKSEQGPGMGAAMLAMVAVGEYKDIQTVCEKFTQISQTIKPEKDLAARYEEKYQKFKKIYPSVKALFKELN